ncbi:MAG: 5-oxoprolinase subunit PxpB [Acidobacteriia bacterium]|nr:5-oxoprolinase subunit PxpB [Terriglobia bacterium]
MTEVAPIRPDLRHASDHTLLVTFAGEATGAARRQVRQALAILQAEPLSGVTDLHPAYVSLLVSYDPTVADREDVRRQVAERLATADRFNLPDPRVVQIPVVYGGEWGPDLPEVATVSGLSPDEVVREHTSGDYVVCFLGFSPGFPYLGGMPRAIAVPRRSTPRTRVAAGSVAIAGSQTGIYPLASPGGWQIIGRTPLTLFDAQRTPPALLATGDRVTFVKSSGVEFPERGSGAGTPPQAPDGSGAIRVVKPGFQSTVQDLGRPGHAHLGVSACGTADPFSLRVGNWLVGNPEGAAAIEMTLLGGAFAFGGPASIAIAGSDLSPTLDGHPVPLWTAVEVRSGQTLTFGATRGGARCTLCVGGEIAIRPVLGSASTHLTSGLGGLEGRALRAGDVLPLRGPVRAGHHGRVFPAATASRLLRRNELRLVRGAQWEWFTHDSRAALFASSWVVEEDSSRMGLRLRGTPLTAERQGTMLTEGVSLGALQVPGGGQPILSFVEHQTTGGYPQIACVIAADIHRVGQLRPRDEVRFVEVTLGEADAALRELHATLRAAMGVT